MLEFLQPASGQDFFFAFIGATVTGEEKGLLPDHFIAEGIAMSLVISYPIGKSLFDIRDSPFGSLNRRSTPVLWVEIFFFLAEHF